MKSFGLRSSIRTTFLVITAMTTIITSAINAQQEHNQAPVNLEAAIDLLSSTIKNFASLNYHTTQKIEIAIPGTHQTITANWGFGGSGYLFSALPNVQVTFETTPSVTEKDTLAIVSETFIKYASLKAKDSSAFTEWISDLQLNPIKLFCLKVVLLTKHAYKQNDIDLFRTELFRLLFRLSLTENIGFINSSNPLSSYLPNVITTYIKAIFPQSIDLIDSLWTAIRSHNNISNVDTLQETKTIQAFVFSDEKLARKCFDHLNNQLQDPNNKKDFITEMKSYLTGQGYHITSYTTFADLTKPKPAGQSKLNDLLKQLNENQPANPLLKNVETSLTHIAQKTFTSNDKDLPTLLKPVLEQASPVSLIADENRWWVVFVSDDLDIISSLKHISQSLINTCKKYAATRKDYFKKHPSEIKQLEKESENRLQQERKIKQFLKTEDGVASQLRIEQKIEQLEQAVGTEKPQSNPTAITTAQKLSRDIQELQEQLDTFNSLLQPGTTNPVLTDIINQLTKSMRNKQAKLDQLTSDNSTRNKKIEEQLDDLISDDLVSIVKQIKSDGDSVPAFLQKKIDELKQHLMEQTKKRPQQKKSLTETLKLRKKTAEVYIDEAKKIESCLNEKIKAINMITDPSLQKIELIKFKALQEGKCNAYISHLTEKGSKIIEENEKLIELDVYRSVLADGSADIDSTQKAKITQLELEVGYLLDGNSQQSFIGSLLGSDLEVRQLLMDLSTKPEYQHLKNDLFDSITHIISRCKHFKDPENKILYEGLIQIFIPEFLPLFNELTT